MNIKKLLAVILALALMVTCFAACAEKKETNENDEPSTEAQTLAESDLDYVKANGKIVIGITDFAPMDYQDENGEWIGFDADMAKEFAKYLGVDVEFVEIDWDNKIFELDSKAVDCIWNGMTLTDEVKSSMECSNPYCNNAQVVVVKASVADKYQTADNCKELNFAVESGSAGLEQAEEYGFEYTEVQNQANAVQEVAAGTSDAAIIDSLMAAAMVGEGTGYENLTYTVALNSEEYGVGFRKGSDICKEFNTWFAKATEDGLTNEIAEKYDVQAALIK